MSINKPVIIVYISGFLTPPNWLSYPEHNMPSDVRMISVYPSPTGSLHDRVCQVFYELVGGRVDYGKKHSDFHGHSQFGVTYKVGKYPQWSESCPILIIGHSFGGLTARVLQNYLSDNVFPGYSTSAAWVSGIIAVNTPFNGVMQVHSKGLCYEQPPVVRWGSQGCIVGWLVHLTEFVNSGAVKKYANFDQAQWRLGCEHSGSALRLLHACLGFCLHSTTDNISFDASIHSQLAWSRQLRTFPDSLYCSVVGVQRENKVKSAADASLQTLWTFLVSLVLPLFRNCMSHLGDTFAHRYPEHVANISTHDHIAADHLHDGLLSAYTQEFPRLPSTSPRQRNHRAHTARMLPNGIHCSGDKWKRGCWNFLHRDMTHLTVAFADQQTWALLWDVAINMHNQQQQQQQQPQQQQQRITGCGNLVGESKSRTAKDTASVSLSGSVHDPLSGGHDTATADMQEATLCLDKRHLVTHNTAARSVLSALALCAFLLLSFYSGSNSDSNGDSISGSSGGNVTLLLSTVCICFVPLCVLLGTFSQSVSVISSDVIETIFVLVRLLTIPLLTHSVAGSESSQQSQHALALSLQCLALLLEALGLSLKAQKARGGVYEYCAVLSKMLLGVVVVLFLLCDLYSSEVAVAAVDKITNTLFYLNILSLVPKVCWYGLYLCEYAQISRSITYSCFICAWALLICCVYMSWSGADVLNTSSGSGNGVSLLDRVVSVLWYAALGGVALNKVRDLSAAFQYFMIRCHYKLDKKAL